jgi:hypothetical protein
MAARRSRTRGSDPWIQFERRHRGNPFLRQDPLYALSEPLLDLLVGTTAGSRVKSDAAAPRFLTEAEEEFERDLARTVSGGFFYRRPFPCLLLPSPATARQAEADRQIRTLQCDLMQDEGTHRQRAEQILAEGARYEEKADRRAAAYAGWLVTNPLFREECAALRLEWGEYIDAQRGFPAPQETFLGFPVGPPGPGGEPAAHFRRFYRRWGLQSFLTWDLPLPMRPSFVGPTFEPTAGLSEAGVNLFLPWYVVRDGQFNLRDLVKHLHQFRNPEHLGGWLNTPTTKREKLGDTRFRNVFILFRYQNLAIQSRYGDRSGWDAARQDEVFARLLKRSEESVRHVRLYLQKQLAS